MPDGKKAVVCPSCGVRFDLVLPVSFCCPCCFSNFHVDADGKVTLPGNRSALSFSGEEQFEQAWSETESKILSAPWPLSVIGPETFKGFGREAVPLLVSKLSHNHLGVAMVAALGLAQLEDAARLVVPHLLNHRLDPHPVISAHMQWALRDMVPECIPVMIELYDQQPSLRPVAEKVFQFLGPLAQGASEVIVRHQDSRPDTAISETLAAIRGPWPADAEDEYAVPYLGEFLQMDWDPYQTGIAVWLAAVESEVAMVDMDWNAWDRAAWNPSRDFDVSACSWAPDQVALERPKLTLRTYDPTSANNVASREIVPHDKSKFVKGELLAQLLKFYQDVNGEDWRIFEGLVGSDGEYGILTGS